MRAAAILTAIVLMIGGIVFGSQLTQVESQAASTSGMPVSHTGVDPNWRTIAGWQAYWQVPLDEESLYWVINRTGSLAGGQVVLWAAYDWSTDMSTYSTRGVLRVDKTLDNASGGTDLSGPTFSTSAMARIGGTKADPAAPLTVYFWDYEVQTTLGDLTCASGFTPIIRATSEQPDLEWSCLPTPYGTRYSAGGEADQYTGNIYMIPGGGTIDDQPSTSTSPSAEENWRFVVWDPVSGSYSLSYSVQPGDWVSGMTTVPSERVKLHTAGDDSGDFNAMASYDISLDSDGNAYTYSGIDPTTGGDGNMSIVRMEPARDADGNIVDGTTENPWRYYVVTKIARADPSQSWSAPSSIYGNGIMNGQLILGANTRVTATGLPATASEGGRGTTTMVKIDPQSATASVVYSVDNRDLTTSTGYDNASSQGAEVIRGTLYQDLNADGAITEDEPGLPNETVALYNASGRLLAVQQTDSMGQYSFLIASVTGANTIFYVRPVEVTTLLPDGRTRVNGAQTWGAGSVATGLSVNKVPLVNTTEIQCRTEGGITSADGGPCSGAHATTLADPAIGALGTTSDPATWLTYAKVTFNTGQYVPTADFGFKASGSFGDAPAGPLTSDVPMHANVPSTVWLGETLGSYTGPASSTTAHASDDGVYLDSYAGRLPLEGAILASGYGYTVGADVSGPSADAAHVAGWTTQAGTNTWNTTASWTPTVADGQATGDFSLSSTGAVQLRVNASERAILLPTNANKEYYGVDTWTTSGEIEDYGLTVADSVIRPAAVTTKGAVDVSVLGQEMGASTAVSVGDAVGVVGGEPTSVSASVLNSQWLVTGITIKDTATGDIVRDLTITPGRSISFTYTPVSGKDVTIEARFAPNIDLEASTLTLDKESAKVGQDITATATIVDYVGDPVPGVTVSFDNESSEITLTGQGGTKTCVTISDGTCSVTVTSTVAGDYPDEVSASIDGDPFTGSPQSVAFTHGDILTLGFAVTPSVDPTDESQTDWRDADGSDSYRGTLTVQDQYGNEVADLTLSDIVFGRSSTDVRMSGITNHQDGTYSVSYTSTVASPDFVATVTYKGNQVGREEPIPFMAGVFNPATSTFEVVPIDDQTTCVADGNPCYTGVLTAMDEHGNPLPGLDVADIVFTASSEDVEITDVVDNEDGTYTVIFSSTTASSETTAAVTYQGNQVGADEPIPFGPGDFDASVSTFTVGPAVDPQDADQTDWCAADGQPCYTGVLTAKDENGNLIPDLTVEDIHFTVSSPAVTISSVENKGDGTYIVRYSSRVGSSTPTTSVTYAGVDVGTDEPIPFGYGELSVDESSFTVTPGVDADDPDQAGWRGADGTDYYTGMLTAKDAQGVLLADLSLSDIVFAASSIDVSITDVVYTGDGTYSVRFTSTVGSSTPTASVAYQDEAVGGDEPIPYTHGEFSAAQSTFQVSPGADPGDPSQEGWRNADGTDSYMGVLTARDSDGNLLAGLTLDDLVFASSSVDVSISDVTYLGGGMYSVRYTSTVGSSDPTAWVTYEGVQVGDDEPIPFAHGEFSAELSVFAVTPQVDPNDADQQNWRAADGVASYTGVLAAKDANGHALAGLSVSDLVFASSSPEVAQSSVTYLGNGMYSVAYTSLVGSSRPTASVTYAGAQVGDDEPIPFAHGEFSADQSSFEVTPVVDPADPDQSGWRSADGTDYYTGVLTARDAQGTVLADLTLSDIGSSSSSHDVTITQVTYTGNGKYQVRYTSTVGSAEPTASLTYAGEQVGEDLPIPFAHGEFSAELSTFTVTPAVDPTDPDQEGWRAADGTDSYAGVLTARDADGNPLAGLSLPDLVFTSSRTDVVVSAVTYLGGGRYSVAYTSEVGASDPTASVSYAGTQVGGAQPIPFQFEPAHETHPTVSVGPSEQTAGDPVTITVTVVDENGDPVTGLTEDDFRVTGTSDDLPDLVLSDFEETEPGVYTWTTTSQDPGEFEVTATVSGVDAESTIVTFLPRQADLLRSSWVVTPIGPLVVGTGETSTYTATATVLDKNSKPVDGVQVRFTVTGSGPAFAEGSTCVTGADGTCVAMVHSTVAGAYPITALTDLGAFTNRTTSQVAASVVWRADQACVVSAGCAPDESVPASQRTRTEVTRDKQTANGTAQDVVTVHVYDRWGNPVQDAAVTDPSSGSGTVRTDRDGVATITYTSTVARSQATNVSVGGSPADDVTLTFVPGPVCTGACVPKGAGTDTDKQTRIIIVSNDALVNEDDSVAVYAFDEYGNPIEDQVFTFITDDPNLRFGGSDQSSIDVVTDETGAGRWTVTSPVAGSHLVHVFIGGQEIANSPLELRFVGPPTITGPADGDTVTSNEVTITGTGQTDGDTIVVTENGIQICTAEVRGGVWSCQARMDDGGHSLIAVEKSADGTQSGPSEKVSFTIDTQAPSSTSSETSVTAAPTRTAPPIQTSPTSTGPTSTTAAPATPSQTLTPNGQAPSSPPGGRPATTVPTGGAADESGRLLGLVTGLMVATIGLWVGVKVSRRQKEGGR